MKDNENTFVLNQAYVHCSCTTAIPNPEKPKASENYRVYSRLIATDSNNGVFCDDEPLLALSDTRPGINILPFHRCQSDYYVPVLSVLKDNAIAKRSKYNQESDLEWIELNSRVSNYTLYISNATMMMGDPKEDRAFTCVLEVLDHWFEPSKTNYVSNIHDLTTNLIGSVGSLKKVLKKLNESIVKYWRDKDWDIYQTEAQKIAHENHLFALQISKDLNKEFDKLFELMRNNLHLVGDFSGVYSSLDIITAQSTLLLTSLTKIEEFSGLVKDGTKRYNEIKNGLINLIDNSIPALRKEIDEFKDCVTEEPVLTNQSILICRCGGIIKIVHDGSWMDLGVKKLQSNLLELLRFIADDLSEKCSNAAYEDKVFKWRYMINAHNEVMVMINSIEKKENLHEGCFEFDQSTFFSIEQPVSVEVKISTLHDVEKQAHMESAAEQIVTSIPVVGGYFTIAFLLKDYAMGELTDDEFSKRNEQNILEAGNTIAKQIPDNKTAEVWGKGLGHILDILGWFGFISDIYYKSYSDFIGEIKVTIYVGNFILFYTAEYDIDGNKKSDITYQEVVSLTSGASLEGSKIDYKIYVGNEYTKGSVKVP